MEICLLREGGAGERESRGNINRQIKLRNLKVN